MIAIVDYQMGNLRSVQKAFERVGHAAEVTGDPAVIAAADKVVLPGVGAFADAIAELKRRELVEPIREAIEAGRPFLGICLGLQLLFERSYEDGEHEGMGILPARYDASRCRRSTRFRTWVGTRFTTATVRRSSTGSTIRRTSTSCIRTMSYLTIRRSWRAWRSTPTSSAR